MNNDNDLSDDDQFPWEDVEAARRNPRLQRDHPVAEGQPRYAATAKPCPKCETPADKLTWFYLESPDESWS